MTQRHGLVRIAALSNYQRVADRVGLDTGPLLRAAGLTPALLADPEQYVPAEPVGLLIEESARLSDCPTFGLQMALERVVSDMGMVSVMIALQPNFDAVLKAMCRYRNSILPIIALNVERHEDIAVINADLAVSTRFPHRQANELLLGALVGIARHLLGRDWEPECVYVAFPEPAPADRPVYTAALGAHVQFNADFNGMTVTLADLDRPREGADPALADHARMLVDHLLTPDGPSFVQRARQAIIFLLGSSQATLEDAAEMLGVQPRTLQRRLESEDVSFRELVHQTRAQLAARFIPNPTLSIAEVADALGYASTAAFSRWHRHEFGASPSEARAHNRLEPADSA